MKGKTTRDRFIGAFGAAGGTLVLTPILQMFIGLEWNLWLLVTLESLGAFFIVVAIVLFMGK